MTPETTDARLLTALLDAAPDAIVVADAQGQILRSNRATEVLFGYPVDRLIGQNVSCLMTGTDATQHDTYMSRYTKTGEARIIGQGREVEGLRADGSVFPVHISIGRTDVDGQPLFVALLHDLSKRRAAERAIERSQRMEAIGQMTGGIAHDFNNLLTVIIGNLELLEMHNPQSAADREILADALEAAELGADLTSRLLAFARKGMLSPEPTEVGTLVDQAAAILKRTLGTRYELVLRVAEATWDINIDQAQLQTAIINLALNARDAMPEGGRISIETSNAVIDDKYIVQEINIALGRYVRISVSDTGHGMDAETQARAFEPFYSTKATGKGTGLGLATVYGFVRQSGGYVALYSELGEGTTISLYFPAVAEAADGDIATGAGAVPSPRGDGQRILVVEDNPQVRRLSVTRIQALGYATEEASTADAAWAYLAGGGTVDLVFSDLVMPGQLTGLDLARRIRDARPEIRVLLTSGYAEEVFALSDDEGFDLIRKPYRQTELAERLHRLLAPV